MSEARDTGERVQLTPAEVKARQRRSQWTALGLIAFAVLIFAVTVVRLQANVGAAG